MTKPLLYHEKLVFNADLKVIMRNAYRSHIAIPAFNIAHLPMIKPIISTLKKLDSFGLVEVSRPDIEVFSAHSLKEVYQEYKKYEDRSHTRLHQDHVPVIDENQKLVDWKKMIKEAIELGFDSVMIDGSRLHLEENIKATKTVVNLAHKKGIPVEAELGAVLGHENGPIPPYEELFCSGKGFTEPEKAKTFVTETKLDWLSVAIGNIHGSISKTARDKEKINARLNIRHLKKIVNIVNVPIVLHGGSGISKNSVLSGIANGITKINIGTIIRQKYEFALRHNGRIIDAQKATAKQIEYLITSYYDIKSSARKLAKTLIGS